MLLETLFFVVSIAMYLALGAIALWGAVNVVIAFRRVSHQRFRSEAELATFLEEIEPPLAHGNFQAVSHVCEGDPRAMPQLVQLAVENRQFGFAKVRQIVVDRFQRDVLADLEHRVNWIGTVIKAAPMVGLLGTVVGMMGAFMKLGSGQEINAGELAGDIYTALITTACGLAIAIPLVLSVASINIRIKKLEDIVTYGLTRFFDVFRHVCK